MLGQLSLVDKIITFLSELDDAMDYPKSFNQLFNWDRYEAVKQRARLNAQQKREARRIKQCLKYLERAKAVTYNKSKHQYKLTYKGWIKFLYYYNKRNKKEKRKHEKQSKSFNRYIIIFDIPEDYARFRDLFRECLKNLGCQLVQKSVWITYDFKVLEFVQKITANCELEGYVKFMKVDQIY